MTSTRLPPMRKRTPAWPAWKTAAEAVSVTVPAVAEAASVGIGEAVEGLPREVQGATVQAVWLVRVTRCGTMSGWQSSSVSALCVKASCGSIAAVQGPATCATCASPMKTLSLPSVSTSR